MSSTKSEFADEEAVIINAVYKCRMCGVRLHKKICMSAGKGRTYTLQHVGKEPTAHECENGSVGLADFLGKETA